jgi:hypothetical protein
VKKISKKEKEREPRSKQTKATGDKKQEKGGKSRRQEKEAKRRGGGARTVVYLFAGSSSSTLKSVKNIIIINFSIDF